MIKIEEIEKLAQLSRLNLTEEEKIKFQKDIDSILNYVDQIQNVNIPNAISQKQNLKNIFREDENPIESGSYTESLVKEFPQKEGNYLKVKKILS
jgi:aspartyl-tRNA(Asn)/glutamyl-tRNA(Gln) amidotransferase subunit C